MKLRKMVALLMMTVFMGGVLSGCEQVDPLDQVYRNQFEEITIRELFEGSEEALRYAKYLNVKCEVNSEYNANSEKIKNKFKYESYYQDEDNYVGVMTGTYTKDSVTTIFNADLSCDCSYGYYVGKKNGVGVHGFTSRKQSNKGYNVQEINTKVDVNTLLYPDLSKATIGFGGLNGKQYVVTLSGDLSGFSVFNGMHGNRGISLIRYYFSADTHVLEKITVAGQEVRTSEVLGKEMDRVEKLNAEFQVKEVSYKDRGVPYPNY